MLQTAAVAFATFFATIGPIDVAAIFASLTYTHTPVERRAIAMRGVLISAVILGVCALFGESLLYYLGISLAALRTAGGILLLLIAIDMVFARGSGGATTTEAESREALTKPDISVFPLATPLIAGPGAMGATILLMADAHGEVLHELAVIAALLTVLAVTFIALLGAGRVRALLGVTGLHVITRVMGVLLSGLAVQFIFDGIAASGLLASPLTAPAIPSP